jgi:hypothetical protein
MGHERIVWAASAVLIVERFVLADCDPFALGYEAYPR